MKFTDTMIRALKPAAERYDVREADGFGVRVATSGTKSWQLVYTMHGRRRRMTLGAYPDVSLAQARILAADARRLIAAGVDPIEARQDEQQRAAEAFNAPTVREFVDAEYLPRRIEARNLSAVHAARCRRTLERACRLIGRMRVADVTRRDLVAVVDAADEYGTASGAEARSVIRALFEFAVERGLIEASPAAVLPRARAKTSRARALTDDELRVFLRDLGQVRERAHTTTAMRLILLLGQRPGEVAGMRWDEIDGSLWRIPAGRMKAGRAHVVPLSRQALALIDALRAVRSSPYVFAPVRRTSIPQPITTSSIVVAIRREQRRGLWQALEHFTAHDLRRSCRTGLAQLGVDHVVAERVLAHAIPGVQGVYDRHDYLPEMRLALQRWADHLDRLVSGDVAGNVVAFR